MERPVRFPPALLTTLILALLVVLSIRGLDIDFGLIFSMQGIGQIGSYFYEMFPPDLSGDFLHDVFFAAVETLAISIMGTVFAIPLGIALALFATRNIIGTGRVSGQSNNKGRRLHAPLFVVSRLILNVLRSIPELLWAIIFILVVGLGPFAGVLALSLHTGGVLGKLYADVLENVDPQPVEAIAVTGAGRVNLFFYSVLPQALPQCLSYTLYRWEMNIREATILGFVGAGGIGLFFYKAINLFYIDRVLTLIIAVYIMVNLVDMLSQFLRRKVQ
ncbi:MAG: phosphonate ABC transporter, permease protein PhnE [Mariprofundus sp.]|nr:phosphonate ABC transporter, permease protein PhnE [Mariprofundus sp.]